MRSNNSSEGQDAGTFLRRARRGQIIGCAIDALAELGFTRTSIAEVAKRAGVSKSVVLYHFTSAAALMEAVVTHVYAGAGTALLADMRSAASHRERLAVYIRGCTDFAWTHRTQTRAVGEIFRNLRTDDGRLRYRAKDGDDLVGVVRDLLVAGQRAGEFGEFDARALAIVVRSTIDGLPGAFESDPALDGRDMAEHLVHIFDAATRRRDAGESDPAST